VILFAVAALAASSPLADFNRRSAGCEADKNLIGSTYAACVLDAAAKEQRQFHGGKSVALGKKLITRQRFRKWQKARDLRCKREGRTVPNYAYEEVVRVRCIARADDKLLRSLRLAHR
jgi:hypothetical protein